MLASILSISTTHGKVVSVKTLTHHPTILAERKHFGLPDDGRCEAC